MLQLATAALVIERAGRLDAVWRALADALDFRLGVGWVDVRRLNDDFFTRQGAGDEDDLFLEITDPFAVNADPLNRHGKLLAFFDFDVRLLLCHISPSHSMLRHK